MLYGLKYALHTYSIRQTSKAYLILSYLIQNPSTGLEEIWFVFQKMTYTYDSEEKKTFLPVDFPCDLHLKSYMDWKGYEEEDQLKAAERKYGKNR